MTDIEPDDEAINHVMRFFSPTAHFLNNSAPVRHGRAKNEKKEKNGRMWDTEHAA
jgi:hypothetical protein